MRQLGMKLWSSDFLKNKSFVNDAEKALKENYFDFLELFALPDSFDDTKDEVLKRFDGVKTVIHAPYPSLKLDISNPDELENNRKRLKSSQEFADMLDADIIILHPGANCGEKYLAESIRQFIAFNDKRLTVENMPGYCSQTLTELHGVTPDEIIRFIAETGAKFCLDFSHAICGANSYKCDIFETLKEFSKLNPAMYHMCDGDIDSVNDDHRHYGEGNYDLGRFIKEFTIDNGLITMETGQGIPVNIQEWVNDAEFLRRIEKS